MKRIIGLMFIALALSYCSKSGTDKEGDEKYALSIAPQNLNFAANADSQNIIVASSGQWSLSGGNSWCTPSITSGGNGASVTFSVQKNAELQSRNTSFIFTLGNQKATFLVTQKAASDTEISLNPGSATVSSSSNIQSVIVTCGGTWALSGETVSWCRPSKTAGQSNEVVTFNIDENNSSEDRNATYIFSCTTETAKFVLTQKGKDALTITKSKFEVAAQGEQIAIEVKSNISFKYEIAQADKSWISYVETRAMMTSSLLFSILPNEEATIREGTITITSGIGDEIIKIYQFGASPAIVLTQKSYTVPCEGQTIKVELNSNVDYEVVMPSVDWITESQTRAMSTHTHYYAITENPYGEERSAEIHYLSREYNIDEIVVIRQSTVESIEPPLLTDKEGVYYAISSLNHLIWLSTKTNANYLFPSSTRFVQTADINMAHYAFTPIGSPSSFKWNYDGGGYKLHNLYIDLPKGDDVGLFGYVGSTAKISNIYIASGNIFGGGCVGGIVGRLGSYGSSCVLTGCHNNATIKGLASTGGVVGYAAILYSKISACSNNGAVTGRDYCGGIAGKLGSEVNTPIGTDAIIACYNTGNITATGGTSSAGGIVGDVDWRDGPTARICYCYNTGIVSGSFRVGGIIGQNSGEAIFVYNIGKVVYTGSEQKPSKGSLVGYADARSHVSGFWFQHDKTENAFGNKPDPESGLYSFSSTRWPGPATEYNWPAWTTSDSTWKSLGYWVEGGTPNGINSVFPKLYFEK